MFVRLRRGLWRLAVRLFAREFVRDMYRAVLDRDADAEGLASYLKNPGRPRNPVAVVGALLDSEEFQRRNFARHVPELVGAFYRGILGREPDREGLEIYTAKLARKENLTDALADLIASEEFEHRTLARLAPDLTRGIFQGVLGREADEDGLAAYTARLSRKENVAAALADLIASEEFQRKHSARIVPDLIQAFHQSALGNGEELETLEAFASTLTQKDNLTNALTEMLGSGELQRKTFERLAPDLVRAFHEGLLERGADEATMETYRAKLTQKEDVANVLKELVASEEFEHRMFERLAPDLARAFFQGVMGREADPDGLATYTPRLTRKENLADALARLIDSDEFRHRSLGVLAPDLVQSFYQGVLGREADGEGLANYSSRLSRHGDAGLIVSHILNSQEYKNKSAAPDRLAVPLIDGKCWVFLHIAKTAGSSVQNLLGSFYVPGTTLYREHADNLSKRDPADLARYEMFAGHFNYDSLVYLPRRHRAILTFVREPVARLCSFYYFRRAHEPGHPLWGFQEQAANALDLKAFFQNRAIRRSRDYWNHMTWVIMGANRWLIWRQRLLESGGPEEVETFLREVARPAIRRRLEEFAFVGLMEKFDASVKTMCDLLGKPVPETLPSDNSLAALTAGAAHFKSKVEKQPMTPAARQAIGELIELDQLVYEEATAVFNERLAGTVAD